MRRRVETSAVVAVLPLYSRSESTLSSTGNMPQQHQDHMIRTTAAGPLKIKCLSDEYTQQTTEEKISIFSVRGKITAV